MLVVWVPETLKQRRHDSCSTFRWGFFNYVIYPARSADRSDSEWAQDKCVTLQKISLIPTVFLSFLPISRTPFVWPRWAYLVGPHWARCQQGDGWETGRFSLCTRGHFGADCLEDVLYHVSSLASVARATPVPAGTPGSPWHSRLVSAVGWDRAHGSGALTGRRHERSWKQGRITPARTDVEDNSSPSHKVFVFQCFFSVIIGAQGFTAGFAAEVQSWRYSISATASSAGLWEKWHLRTSWFEIYRLKMGL